MRTHYIDPRNCVVAMYLIMIDIKLSNILNKYNQKGYLKQQFLLNHIVAQITYMILFQHLRGLCPLQNAHYWLPC